MSTRPITIHAARRHLSRLIVRACAGEEIVIARGKQPVARLVPITPTEPRRRPGSMKGRAAVTEAFFDPLSAEDLDAWG
ncbi:MAG: type II toxin-antitoxin system prevent-host-death family antitoxin [Deltaproteobacteria bacterium]|nr:type II toxin-antitoxin system prevent-host-death family antitoxin [Myxococcales bacterium]MDP3216574.1 type II toxin-antitoxin system prevent-host-death family antitoxin [Deltaproteobacteria bacterium]